MIESLKADVAAQTKLAIKSKALQQKVAAKDTEVMKLQGRVGDLDKALSEARQETQVVSAKLASAQAQKMPGSAQKVGGLLGRGILPGLGKSAVVAANEDAWSAKVKEDLFGDLCGLIIMGVKKDNGSRLFECLQTGTNGSKSFLFHPISSYPWCGSSPIPTLSCSTAL